MAAGIVGASGSVVGMDLNPGILETAGARALREGLTNTTFVEGDVGEPMEMDGDFDAAVGRLVLVHQQDPAQTLRSVAATAEEVDVSISTLANRLREEPVASGGVVKLSEVVGAWAPKP